MRRIVSWLMLVAMVLGALPVTSVKAAPVESVPQVINAVMTAVAPNAFDFSGGEVTFDLTFTMNFTSSDMEYADYFEVTLPEEWVVNTVYPATKTGCTSQPTTQGVKPGNKVYWQHEDYWPGEGSLCGPWYGTSEFKVNVTASTCPADEFTFFWFAEGDWWGDAPHTASGVSPAVSCVAQSCTDMVLLTEAFDGVTPTALPEGWAVTQVSGTTANWYTRAGTRYPSGYPAHSAPNLVYFNSWSASTGQQARLFYTLPLDLGSASQAKVDFWMFHDLGYSGSNDRVQVQVSTDGGTTWVDVGDPISRYDGSGPAWKAHSVDLSAYAGQDVMLGFLGISAYGNDIHLDDIVVTKRVCGGGVSLVPTKSMVSACMGTSAVHHLTLVNGSEQDYTIAMTYSEALWPFSAPEQVEVPAGESVPLDIVVDVPAYVMDGAQDLLVVEGVALEDEAIKVKSKLTTSAGNAWISAPAGGAPGLWMASAVLDGKLYYFDGRDENGFATLRTQIFDPATGWSEGAPSPFGPSFGGVAAAYDGKIYYAPGFQDGMAGMKDFGVYDPATDSWTVLAARPAKRGLAVGGVTSTGKFVLVGGSPNAGFLGTTSVYIYDIATDKWTTGATLNEVGFTASGGLMVDDVLYVAGNYFGSKAFYAYDVAANTWTSLGELPEGRVSPVLLSDGLSLYLIGGGVTPGMASDQVWLYNLEDESWEAFLPLPEPLLGAAGGILNGVMFVFGGGAVAAQADKDAPHYQNIPYCGYPLVTLSGTVINGVTEEPIAGALVVAEGKAALDGLFPNPVAYTDEDGTYTLYLNPAVYQVTVSYPGLDSKSAEVALSEDSIQDFVMGPAVVGVTPTGPFEVTLPWGETKDITLTLSNLGYSVLNYEFTERNGGGPVTMREQRIELKLDQAPIFQRYTPPVGAKFVLGKASSGPDAVYRPVTAKSTRPLADAVELVVDDGSAEDSIGLTAGGQLIWLNRFTPAPEQFPFTLTEVWVLFGSAWGSGGVNPGELFDIYIFQDTDGDGDPGTNAELVGSFVDVPVQAADGETWTMVTLDDPVVLYGPGDVLIAVVNRTAGTDAGEYPASIDQDSSQQRSWVGYYGGPVPYPPYLPASQLWGLIDDFGLPGNWTVRGYGVKGLAFSDIPWLYTTPVSGTVAPVDADALLTTTEVVLTFDALAVQALGTYTGTLLLNTNDPESPVVEFPVQLNVVANPDAGELEGTVTSDRPGGALPDSVVWLEGPDGFELGLTTDEDGYYHTYIHPDHLGVYTITVANEAGYIPDVQVVTLTKGLKRHDVELIFNAPWMVTEPEAIEVSVIWGEQAEAPITVENIGTQKLNYVADALLVAYYEDFEASDGGYTVEGSNASWEWGVPTSGPGTAWSGAKVWATNLSGDYNNNEASCIVSPPIDLSAYQGYDLFIDWYEYGNVELNWDYWYTEISVDGGETWELINGLWTGNTDGWMEAPIFDSPHYLGPAYAVPEFRIRFCLQSDSSIVRPGYYVDDVRIWAPVPWASFSSDSGTVEVEAQDTFTVTMDSTLVDRPGTYLGSVMIMGDDPFNSFDVVPMTFEVQANPNQGYIHGRVIGNRVLGGENLPVEGAVIYLHNDVTGGSFMTETDANGEFEIYLLPNYLQAGTLYFLEVYKQGYLPFVEVFPFNYGDRIEREITIRLAASLLTVSPESIHETLDWGDSTALPMTVSNPNPATLALSAKLIEVSSVFEPLYPTTVQLSLPAVVNTTAASTGGAILDSPFHGTVSARTQDVKLDALALGKLKVLIFNVDGGEDPAYVAWLMDALSVYPDLEVDFMPANPAVSVEELLPYNVVIFGGRWSSAAMDPDLLGDTFAEYVDRGGRVIMIQNAFYAGESDGIWWKLGGRFEEEYSPVEYGGFVRYIGAEYLEVYNPSHPIMAGWDPDMNFVWDSWRSFSDLMVRPGAQIVAYWNTGNYYIVANQYAVVFNQVLTYDPAWEGDVPMLLHNAILFLASGDAPWIEVADKEFKLSIGAAKTTQVSLDASVVDQPGTYRTWLWFINDDPFQQGAYVPAAMTVLPDATMMNVSGRVTSNRTGEPIEGAIVTLEGPASAVVRTDAEGRFTYWFVAEKAGQYTLSIEKPGYLPYNETLTLNAGDRVFRNVILTLDAAWINATAEEMEVRLSFTTEATRTITIENWGERDLEFRFSELPAEVPPPGTLMQASILMDNAPLKVDPAVIEDLKDGTASFWVRLRQSANLKGLPRFVDANTRATYVYTSLKAVADASQGNILAYARQRGLQAESFWIVNSVLIKGATAADLEAFQAMPEVAEIKGRFTAQLHADNLVGNFGLLNSIELIERASQPGIQWSGTAWGLIFTGADKVWSEFGVTGAGVTVANIDTGVQWDHPALKEQYRGWDGSSAEHNYNWYAPTNAAKNACPGAAGAPCDWSGHGSHTMGTMVGDDHVSGDAGHRTGMAPGAKWVACMGCDTPPNSCSDEALTRCAEWMVAPTDVNGNNPDPSKRPDVINNSWGGGGGDFWYQSYVEAWVAAGMFPAFSAGNSGPGCRTTGSPGDYAISFASGAVDSSGMIADFSSRGPGNADADLKPDIAAPGVAVCSSVPGNGYDCSYSGTSMASPHTAGAVALMWSAAPMLKGDIEMTRQILTDTANPNVPDEGNCGKPAGTPGIVPNYTYGYGYLDAYAAVRETMLYLDVPWLTVTPVTGTVPVMGTLTVEVGFNGADLEPGVYTATLVLGHNDPIQKPIALPVKMTIAEIRNVYLPLTLRNW